MANRFYLVYFDDSSEYHEHPFLLLIENPEARDKDWSDLESCRLLTASFDEFYKNSAFLSLLPNERNKKHYKLLVTIKNVTIKGELHLGHNRTIFVAKDFALRRFTGCASLLESSKIGTVSLNRFYEVEDRVYGLFITACYILYQDPFASPKLATSFRTGDLAEMDFLVFRVNSVQGKIFLISKDEFFAVDKKRKLFYHPHNIYNFKLASTAHYFNIIFESRTNMNQPFRFFAGLKELNDKEIEMPVLQRLSQIDKRVYLLRCVESSKITVEVPSYFFGQELTISKLVVPFRFNIENEDRVIETQVIFGTYNFDRKDNSFWFCATKKYLIHFDYFIEGKNIVFIVTKVIDPTTDAFVPISTDSSELYKGTRSRGGLPFLNGTLVYNGKTALTLKESETNTNPVSEEGIKYLCKKHKNKLLFLLTGLALVVVCLFIKRLFYPNIKKKLKQRRKTSKRVYFKA